MDSMHWGGRVFNWRAGWGGSNRPPQSFGGGGRAQLTGPLISYYEL